MTERARALEQGNGAVLILTAFIFIALLAIAALVVDIVVIHQAKLKAQSMADATVVAAALAASTSARATVRCSEDVQPCESNFFGAVSAKPPVFEPIIRLYD